MRVYKNEREAEERLSGREGLEYFIPKRYEMRVRHGKKEPRPVPVIPGLVFVHATHRRIVSFKQEKYNSLQFIMTGIDGRGGYLIVPDREMESFIRVCGQYSANTRFYKPGDLHIGKGMKVRVHGGPFDGVEGIFVKVAGRRSRQLVVLLAGLMAASTTVEPEYLEILKG